MSQYTKYWAPYRKIDNIAQQTSLEKSYVTPPNLYINKQKTDFAQYLPIEALEKGTLWKYFYDPYVSPYEQVKE